MRRVKRLSARRKREYVKSGGGIWCPYCRSREVRYVDDDFFTITRNYRCETCGADWIDSYDITDVIGRSDEVTA
uniref:Uncharacterized protein n=1 Tax=viral metagenome TaxID=1070528 RepID=A0A6M3JEZ5_9ZZZZ